MQLSRRDAAAALAALGVGGGGAVGAQLLDGTGGATSPADEPRPSNARVKTVFVAVATVVYPETVSGIPAFVDRFLVGRLTEDAHATGIRETVADLDRLAVDWHGDPIEQLAPATRDHFLREVGADTAEEVPDGTTAERVRYYVVNDLLLALYTSPAGGALIGLENPPGHPGGTTSYQSGPP